jgi:glycogen phosphorylase
MSLIGEDGGMAHLAIARSGAFSSDRAIEEYCDDIWQVGPVTVTV